MQTEHNPLNRRKASTKALQSNSFTTKLAPIFTLSLLSAAIFTASTANASGLFLQEAVVANAGTTGAGDGVYTQSAAAMWTNPATMSHMGESLTTVNVTAFDLEMKYQHETGDPADNGKAHTVMPSLSVFHARQLNEDVHLGLAFGTVGGSSLDYGHDWAGSNLMTDITLTALQFNPALSFRVTDQVSWGLGAQFNWASLEMGMGSAQLEQSSDWAYGFNAGVMYKHSDKLDLGVSFRSKVEHEFSTNLKTASSSTHAVASDLAVPAIVDVSASYAATSDLNLLASIQLHRWSEWDQTVFDFGYLPSNPAGLNSIDRQWDDVWKFAIGTDYRLNADWRLKAGFSYETSPQEDPTKQWVDLPVGEQYRYSLGASTQWDGYTFDVFYEYADFGSVEIAERRDVGIGINGTFEGRIHFVGMNLTF
ncbi:outer membrane protein transport protein [Vibrio sp. SCSIO 43135]|uniref:OmpP1/FadL family transporter n=1 Tax=Vibrio sp. SCSIO 43135 TaxID=2819096 RepID=UPI0020750F9A|nr:outer membrane protein transport protein [Vibrio sp. SCSIO 43135]USD43591.1 outer membrane protein transport protein [Vibrio sp. SCSIO 43135]